MDPYSIRRRLGERQFDPLPRGQYLEKLRVVADESASHEARTLAKEELLKAHFRLIANLIDAVTVGIEGPSDNFDSMAGHMYSELSEMAEYACDTGTALSTMIVRRVAFRICSKIRHEDADRRAIAQAKLLKECEPATESSQAQKRIWLEESCAELRAAVEVLPETERNVCQALDYGLETEQDFTISDVARALGIPETTARSAFVRAREWLQHRFKDSQNGQPS